MKASREKTIGVDIGLTARVVDELTVAFCRADLHSVIVR